jgi:hypothetical protein
MNWLLDDITHLAIFIRYDKSIMVMFKKEKIPNALEVNPEVFIGTVMC